MSRVKPPVSLEVMGGKLFPGHYTLVVVGYTTAGAWDRVCVKGPALTYLPVLARFGHAG